MRLWRKPSTISTIAYEAAKISRNLSATSKICNEMVVNMVEVGEETGELDKMLTKVADNYDDEVDRAVEAMVSLIEPIMIVFLGGTVGFIVIAMFVPLIKIMQGLGAN